DYNGPASSGRALWRKSPIIGPRGWTSCCPGTGKPVLPHWQHEVEGVGRLLRPHADQVGLWRHKPVARLELPQRLLDLGPRCILLRLTLMGHELGDLRQDISAVLHGGSKRCEPPLEAHGLDADLAEPGSLEGSPEYHRFAERKHAGIAERRRWGTATARGDRQRRRQEGALCGRGQDHRRQLPARSQRTTD